jgi:hypothetical protein
MANSQKIAGKTFANFYSELNMRFTDELVYTQNCKGLINLDEVYSVEHDRRKGVVVMTRSAGTSMGAAYDVKNLAANLAKKYKIRLEFPDKI